MPKILEKCVRDMRRKGTKTAKSWAVCTAALQKAGKLKKRPKARRKGGRRR